jgi:hypothetical protein
MILLNNITTKTTSMNNVLANPENINWFNANNAININNQQPANNHQPIVNNIQDQLHAVNMQDVILNNPIIDNNN